MVVGIVFGSVLFEELELVVESLYREGNIGYMGWEFGKGFLEFES